MANDASNSVIERLHRYFSEDSWLEKSKKKNPEFAQAIENLSADDISFGDQPTLIKGYAWGNSTGAGESSYGNSTTKRTTSIDFTTDEFLVISDSNTASTATCRAAACYVLDGWSVSDVISKHEIRSVAEKHGKQLCREALSDLDFPLDEYRLNRYGVEYTSDAFKVPIWPIFASIVKSNGKSQSVHLGYYYTLDGDDYIHMDISTPMTTKNKLIMIGAIAGAVIVGIMIISALL